jgi:hypothetical protein
MSGIAIMSGDAGDAGTLSDEAIPVLDRHELRRRLCVHIHELGEEELDAVLISLGADGVGKWTSAHGGHTSLLRVGFGANVAKSGADY